MAGEFTHRDISGDPHGRLTQADYESASHHVADGQLANDLLYFNGTAWVRATPATIAGILDWAADITTHAALDTGVHGAGANTLATDADITTHEALTTGVHGAGANTLATDADIDTDITTHAALVAAHHAKYTDAEAITAAKTVKLDELSAPTDVATLNASTSAHGLLLKLDNVATNFLNGQGAWAAPSSDGYTEGARVSNSANLLIATASLTALTFDTEAYDTDTIHSTVSNTSRLTATTAGKYIIVGNVQFDAHATGFRDIYITLNAGGTTIGRTSMDKRSDNYWIGCVTTIYNLSATDYVELKVYQTSGGNLNVLGNVNSPLFMMQRVG